LKTKARRDAHTRDRSALEVPGFNREQIFKRLFWECDWWNRAPEIQEWIKDAVRQAASGVPFRGDSRYFWADGSEHNVDFACIPIRDAAGKVVVLVATGMDITERVHAEEQRRALEEQRLRSDALAVLDRAKTEFFSNVSHEFRTPLARATSGRLRPVRTWAQQLVVARHATKHIFVAFEELASRA
jgi:PAS domain S-box-containing protein